MPNNIKNILTFTGPQDVIDSLIEQYTTHHPRKPSRSYDNSLIYKNSETGEYGWLNEETNIFTRREKQPTSGVPEGFEQYFEEAYDHFPDFEKVFPQPENIFRGNLGKKEEEMCAREGRPTWYDWNRENWGTKWNSYCFSQEDGKYIFETAWNSVPHIIEKMSYAYPAVHIEYLYADEDFGYNCGILTYQKGLKDINIPEGGSSEALRIATIARPSWAEDMVEEVDGEYRYKEEEE